MRQAVSQADEQAGGAGRFRLALTAAAAVLLAALAKVACAEPPAADISLIPARAHAETFTSSVNGHRYELMIGLPLTPPPPEGYSVIYVLDGNFYFASALEAARAAAPATMVVGIGYPLEDGAWTKAVLARNAPVPPLPDTFPAGIIAAALERSYDLTLPASDAALAAQQFPGAPPQHRADVGGADDLLRTIEQDVKPLIAARAKLNPQQQTLLGYSLGGLTVLRALFSEPAAFRTFIAASPSIWWNARAVLAGEAEFAAAVRAGAAAPRVLITVGADEDSALPKPQAVKGAAIFATLHMVENARNLAARLAALPGRPPYKIEYATFARQSHGISFWPALGRAIPFAAEP